MFFELDKDHEILNMYTIKLVEDIKAKNEEERSEHQKLYLDLIDQYGTRDIGAIFSFFFNILRMKIG